MIGRIGPIRLIWGNSKPPYFFSFPNPGANLPTFAA
jgi:hypothetical protein